jgi:hypothetical protein
LFFFISRYLPAFDELCSAELLNTKQMVPCDPIKYLNSEYGTFNWLTPISLNYKWSNLKFTRKWNDNEWKRAYKYYNLDGSLNHKKTQKYINKHLGYNNLDKL